MIPRKQSVSLGTSRLRGSGLALAACIFFFSAGRAVLPHLGVQNDEALFASAFYEPRTAYVVHIGHSTLPLMLMDYLGTLKAWIYRPIFRNFGTGVSVLRDPMLLAGAASVWLFFLLLRRIAGERAAIIGCAALAADSLYLLTICFDWGPVALQHLLLVGALLQLVRFYQTGRSAPLGWGFLLMGLAMWDKALAVWMLGGISMAALVTFPQQIRGVITGRRVGLSAAAFALGALPLVIYNVDRKLATFRNSVAWDFKDVPGKARLLVQTVEGGVLFGWLADEDWETPVPHQPKGLLQKASAGISALARHPRRSLALYAFVLAVLLAPLAWGRGLRSIVFALIAMAIGWGQMAITANAGGSVHHSILLWPLPQMVMAVSLAAASRRMGRAGIPALAAVVVVLIASEILVTNEYYARIVRNGGAMNWTDAIFQLSDYMKGVPAKYVFPADWGIMDSLRLLNRGKLPLRVGTDPISKPELNPEDRKYLLQMISDPADVFIAHTKDLEFFKGVNEKLVEYAANLGYRRKVMAVISDSYGRPTYEVYRFVGP